MDPVTAAFTFANTVAEIWKLSIESMPPETRAEFAKMQVEDLKNLRAFVEKVVNMFKPERTVRPPARRKTARRRRQR